MINDKIFRRIWATEKIGRQKQTKKKRKKNKTEGRRYK